MRDMQQAGDCPAALLLVEVVALRAALEVPTVSWTAAATALDPLLSLLNVKPDGTAPDTLVAAEACQALLQAVRRETANPDIVSSALVMAEAPAVLAGLLSQLNAKEPLHQVESSDVIRSACGVLALTATSPGGAAALVRSGCLNTIAALLTCSDPAAMIAACAPLAKVAEHHSDPTLFTALCSSRVMVAIVGALETLANAAVGTIALPADIVKAVDALMTLVANAVIDDTALESFLGAGGLPPLLALLMSATATRDMTVASHVISALVSLSVDERGAVALAIGGAAQVLLDVVQWQIAQAGNDDIAADPPNVGLTAMHFDNACWALERIAWVFSQSNAGFSSGSLTMRAVVDRGLPLLQAVLNLPCLVDEPADATAHVQTALAALARVPISS